MPTPSHVIVIGTSAGGMLALTRLVEQLPATLPAAVLVVQHLAPDSSGEPLVERLSQHSGLRCTLARHEETLQAGTLYLAPPDRHLLVKETQVLVTKGPRENNYRPAADALFRSAAVAFGPNVVGVVLTGMLHDGTAGLDFIKRCGGVALVQDPADAEYPSMPESAMRNVEVDYVLPIDMMGRVLQELVGIPTPAPGSAFIPEDLKVEAAIAERIVGNIEDVRKLGQQVPITCPDCGGALWELNHGSVLRYRCHTGHSFTADALLEKSQDAMEETLWVALRMMEERKNLLTSMASHGTGAWSVQQAEKLEEIKQHVNRLREFLLNGGPAPARPDGSHEDESALR
ncbi:two-component system chemotaxis response regulator CheB [Hymenobacter luteus]|uniref:protein-glutamate methylesterase n=2 Tax=Hymenobacter TaxID=89966 RepID=A0A7W9T551_9BACT|nr:chemotaxis protein CheB [Hymenobacter latericoloratus]MBB4603093.1 two-component system chemotaxis response regulator CheB [Hymenobacter latericoloratus]MBB6060948.1 two-component system chemotaxis response regulator CheB [Hymenobacter luteus]